MNQAAAAKLRQRGLRPTNFAVVARLEVPKVEQPEQFASLSRLFRLLVPTLHAQADQYDVVLQSWDDGDHATWEGNSYVREYSTGDWMSRNNQHQLPVPPEPYIVNWAEPVAQSMQPRSDCRKLGSACGYCGQSYYADCTLRQALNDRWGWCVGIAAGCSATGPGWFTCAGIGCYAQIFGGFLWFTKQHFNQCWLDEEERLRCEG